MVKFPKTIYWGKIQGFLEKIWFFFQLGKVANLLQNGTISQNRFFDENLVFSSIKVEIVLIYEQVANLLWKSTFPKMPFEQCWNTENFPVATGCFVYSTLKLNHKWNYLIKFHILAGRHNPYRTTYKGNEWLIPRIWSLPVLPSIFSRGFHFYFFNFSVLWNETTVSKLSIEFQIESFNANLCRSNMMWSWISTGGCQDNWRWFLTRWCSCVSSTYPASSTWCITSAITVQHSVRTVQHRA